MKIEIGKTRFEISWLKEVPERHYYDDGVQWSAIRALFEVGIDEREEYKIYYCGLMRLLFAVSVIPNGYNPSWVIREEAFRKCVPFRRYKKKRIKHDPFNRSMGDKPSE